MAANAAHKHIPMLALFLHLLICLPADDGLGLRRVGATVDVVTSSPPAAGLFVFGDSYADTGNHNPSDPLLATPWRPPYGRTWPHHPSGRFSDGRVFTDFYASSLEVRKPVPYRIFMNQTSGSNSMKHGRVHRRRRHPRGVNFAYGGSGVFPSFGKQFPDIKTQIEQLRDLMTRGLVSKKLVKASTALLVVSGNDYTAYNETHPNYQGITGFIPEVVEEMGMSLQALHDVGFRRIAATSLAPLGCLPVLTYSSNFTACNLFINQLTGLHNSLLASRVSALQAKHPKSHIFTIDLHAAFQSVIQDGRLSLKPCCEGIGGSGGCGDLDKQGRRLYRLCSSSGELLFWDDFHPTNAAWAAISLALFSPAS